jgi:transcription antitermination factor NusG
MKKESVSANSLRDKTNTLTDRKLFKGYYASSNMETTISDVNHNLLKLMREIELIKHMISAEGELTPWAKKEIKKARAKSEETYTSLKEL